jgi:cysteine desulfurase
MTHPAPLYLDNNATTPLRTAAAVAMQDVMGPPANPSSVHGFGRAARLVVEDARLAVAQLAGCRASDVVFTSGGTEANNLVLSQYTTIITSAIEHDSVRAAHPNTRFVKVTADGAIDCDDVQRHVDAIPAEMRPSTLLSIMAANNETGVLQPLHEIADIAAAAGIALHSDMVQVFGKASIDFATTGISYASLSAHKIGGPAGVGALLVRPGCRLASLLKGGGQEQGRRSGTENLIGIAGFGAAAKAARDDVDHFTKMAGWRDAFETKILAALPDTVIFGKAADRLGNTSCLVAGAKTAETMVMAFDLAGVAVSAGAACSSGKVRASHVLEAMGAESDAGRAIRISGGWATTPSDFERLADVFLHLYKQSG